MLKYAEIAREEAIRLLSEQGLASSPWKEGADYVIEGVVCVRYTFNGQEAKRITPCFKITGTDALLPVPTKRKYAATGDLVNNELLEEVRKALEERGTKTEFEVLEGFIGRKIKASYKVARLLGSAGEYMGSVLTWTLV